ncbi:hypothetical protein SAMN04487783_1365 [Agrococcus baldri]|uniref:Uncharacterized protein n=1 Tax=Agrococcus baldri TaxID=153730 RepID=A0AA94HM90_9MICO|nr:hypothetical protein [Agrococcus baldri]SFS10139.1 hypothetical protein SAMN04487783_1365 [Agrococcus baldri]
MLARATRLILPAVWLGLIIGISLIETPLKFQAPGITIPLGLGIGRLVFAAMNIVEGVLAVLLLLAVFRSRARRPERALAIALAVVLALKALVIRPMLHGTTDAVVTGASEGGSGLHYLYIAADGLLLVGLVAMLVLAARSLLGDRSVTR